jgi:hypothetical protein
MHSRILVTARSNEHGATLARPLEKPQQARDLVALIYGWFMKDTRDLRRLKALLDALAA